MGGNKGNKERIWVRGKRKVWESEVVSKGREDTIR